MHGVRVSEVLFTRDVWAIHLVSDAGVHLMMHPKKPSKYSFVGRVNARDLGCLVRFVPGRCARDTRQIGNVPNDVRHALPSTVSLNDASLTTASYATTRAFQNLCTNRSSHGSFAASASCSASSPIGPGLRKKPPAASRPRRECRVHASLTSRRRLRGATRCSWRGASTTTSSSFKLANAKRSVRQELPSVGLFLS